MELRSPPSLYSLATGVFSSKCFAQPTSKLDEILPIPILLDVLLQRAGSQNVEDVMSVNEEMCRLSTFTKLVTTENRDLVRRLCKGVSHAGIGKENLFPERLAVAFQNEIPKANPNIIEDGVKLGEFLHEAGFPASATVLKLCLENYQKEVPIATTTCVADKQRYKIIVALLQAQVRYSMREEAQSTREQALEFIEKWKLSQEIPLAELYSALSSLATLEGKLEESFELNNKALESKNASGDHYSTKYGASLDIFGQWIVSYIDKWTPEITEDAIVKALNFAYVGYGPSSAKYADILAISYQYFMAKNKLKKAFEAAQECLKIRTEIFGASNVLTESARKSHNMVSGAVLRRIVQTGRFRVVVTLQEIGSGEEFEVTL